MGECDEAAGRGPILTFPPHHPGLFGGPLIVAGRMRCSFVAAIIVALGALLSSAWWEQGARAQGAGVETAHIEWEVKNRFRLFRNEADFARHVAADRGEGVLAAEHRLARETDGRGWARDVVERLCVDRAGNLLEYCDRDGQREIYLAPRDHRIGVTLAGTIPANGGCVWTFDDGEGSPRTANAPCNEEVRTSVRYGRTTTASVDLILPDGTAQRMISEIKVRDVLIAGMGDSIAAGEGNPDRAIRLSDEGFCFKRFGGSEYFRPGREGFRGNKSCAPTPIDNGADDWARQSARWLSGPCHRSLYSYQTRAALALAVDNPHLAVTFIPLACSGATVDIGFLGSLRILECPSPGTSTPCARSVRAQVADLAEVMATARRHNPYRALDLILLTIGANDVYFSGLMANVIVEPSTERSLLTRAGKLISVEESQRILDEELPANFARLRAALKPFVAGDLSRVVYVTYANPALTGPNTPCAGGRDGFDVHPAFGVDGERLRHASEFVSQRFLPRMKTLARCEDRRNCRDPATEAMTFVDAHQGAFASHGTCARSNEDPPFDRNCFHGHAEAFRSGLTQAATDPMSCGYPASEFRPYASRARWIRTANDSYLTAMTYPEGLPLILQPSDLHDAIWGLLAAVYGGAVHPTAEGHAAMADAALPVIQEALGLSARSGAVRTEPLPAPQLLAPQNPAASR
jgi:hypothetical protein